MKEQMTTIDIAIIASMLRDVRPELIKFAESVTKEDRSADYYEGFIDALNTVQTGLAADRYLKTNEFPSEI